MQQFPCPFCGLRDEREFHFAGEAGKMRPDTTKVVSDAEWSAYLHECANAKGPSREIWVHTTCQEYFVMTRDTVSMEVIETASLHEERA